MTRIKKQFVNVTPLTPIAKNRFSDIMESFHACEVQKEKDDMMLLCSLNKQYCFWVQRDGNEHWKISK